MLWERLPWTRHHCFSLGYATKDCCQNHLLLQDAEVNPHQAAQTLGTLGRLRIAGLQSLWGGPQYVPAHCLEQALLEQPGVAPDGTPGAGERPWNCESEKGLAAPPTQVASHHGSSAKSEQLQTTMAASTLATHTATCHLPTKNLRGRPLVTASAQCEELAQAKCVGNDIHLRPRCHTLLEPGNLPNQVGHRRKIEAGQQPLPRHEAESLR